MSSGSALPGGLGLNGGLMAEVVATMSPELAALLPLALASAFMPTRTVVTARLMLTRHPRSNAIAFVAGNWIWRVVLGLVVLSVLGFDATGAARLAAGALRLGAGIAALVFAVLAVVQWHFGHKVNLERIHRWSARLDGLGPTAVFGATVATQWLPGSQWLLVIAGAGVIHSSGLAPPLQFLALAQYAAGQLVMVASPILMPRTVVRRAEDIRRGTERLRDRASEKGFIVPAVLSIIFALVALGSLSR